MPERRWRLFRVNGCSADSTAFQQPCELRLKLQSTNSIAVLLAADAGFVDFVQQGKMCAEEVRTLD